MLITALEQAPSGETGFINETELLKRLLVSRRTLFNWRKTNKIPWLRLGTKLIFYHWPSVVAEMLRQQKGFTHEP